MTHFRTTLPPQTASFRIHHQQQCLCIGSCFAQHIGQKLAAHKFRVHNNPFGILYNPWSIQQAFDLLLSASRFEADQLIHQHGLWHSFQHHGSFSGSDKAAVLANINQQLNTARNFLKDSQRLLLTLGTAFVFVHKDNSQPVANCHKLPAAFFERILLPANKIIELFRPLLEQLHQQQPELQVVLTVSPVRHLRDGLVANQRSKAHLLTAVHQLCDQLDFVSYFPAYELLLDDLRDYRFYNSDMLHPNEQAIDYIWNYFGNTYFSEFTRQLNGQIGKILQASRHHPFHPQSDEHRQFVHHQLQQIEALEGSHSFLNFDAERAVFSTDS